VADSATIHTSAIRRLSQTLQAPWATETADQIHALDRELVRRRQLERLLPADAVDVVMNKGMLATQGESRVVTIMFVDIRESARLEDSMSPIETIEFLNRYLGAAAREIIVNRGSVNKFIGDGILAVFGLVDESDHGARNAVMAADSIHHAFKATCVAMAQAPVRAVVAIHTGPAIIGVIGLTERSDYAILGRTVNVASRLEGEAKQLGLSTILTGTTVSQLTSRPESLRHVTTSFLRGISEGVDIWTFDSPS
jgi:adenylate cyclase